MHPQRRLEVARSPQPLADEVRQQLLDLAAGWERLAANLELKAARWWEA